MSVYMHPHALQLIPMGLPYHSILPGALYNRVTRSGRAARPDLGTPADEAMRAITINAACSWQMEKYLGSNRAKQDRANCVRTSA
jgi:hypothetical protein